MTPFTEIPYFGCNHADKIPYFGYNQNIYGILSAYIQAVNINVDILYHSMNY